MNDTIEKVLGYLTGVKVPQKKFMSSLLTVMMCCMGRATFRNMSRFSEPHEKTFSRWYRRPFEYDLFNVLLLQEEKIAGGELVAAIDASFLSKSGKQTAGLGYFWNGSRARSEKGLEISTVAVVDVKANTAYALDSLQTLPNEGVGKRVEQYCQQITSVQNHLRELDVRYLCTDGYYTKQRFMRAVEESGLNQIGKLRHDANLWFSYQGDYSGKGRPRKYGEKTKQKGELLEGWKLCETEDDGTRLYQAELYLRSTGKLLNVVLLRNDSHGKRAQALLFSTDLNQEAHQIVTYYRARFQIEFLFRDAKQHTGLADCQARSAPALHTHVNASFTALNIMKLEDRRYANTDEETVISIETWRRRKINQNLMNRLYDMLDLDLNDKKVKATYEILSNFGSIAA